MLGYDIEDEERNYDKQGLTGTVTRYSTTSMQYPCYIIHEPFERYKITVLRSMFNLADTYDESLRDKSVTLYLSNSGNLIEMGSVLPQQVNAVLKLFESNEVEGYINENTQLQGDLLYALGGLS